MILQKIAKALSDQKSTDRQAEEYRDLIRREAKIGGQLFGPVPLGHRREFFCLDEHTWIWYEEWTDANSQRQAKTTRYDVRPQGVIKMQDGHPPRYVSLEEARNLHQAAKLYKQRIDAEYGIS